MDAAALRAIPPPPSPRIMCDISVYRSIVDYLSRNNSGLPPCIVDWLYRNNASLSAGCAFIKAARTALTSLIRSRVLDKNKFPRGEFMNIPRSDNICQPFLRVIHLLCAARLSHIKLQLPRWWGENH